jgi:CheY-like chemotaxis protein
MPVDAGTPFVITKELMKTVLLVEDDHDTRVVLRQNLEREGYFVFTAANGKDGLEALQRLDPLPGAIIVDLLMPIMGGKEFIGALRARGEFSGIPVIVISAQAKELPDGAAALLHKPFDLAHLIAEVRRLTGDLHADDPQ